MVEIEGGDINSKTFKNKKNEGDSILRHKDGQFKRIRKTTDGFGVEIIDINTYDPEAEEAAKVDFQILL